jgi:molecular chaperone DnaK
MCIRDSKEAETFAEEDRKRKEFIEAKNMADNAVYTAEKALRDLGEKVPGDLRSQVEDEVAKVRAVMDGDDLEAIKTATEALNQVIQQIGAAAYQQEAPEAGGPGDQTQSEPGSEPDAGAEGDAGDDEDVVDAEFHDA